MSRILFPAVPRPAVSIVMVTYGGWEIALRALRAIRDHTEPCYEVVVVDNASPDDTPARLRQEVGGATFVLNDENAGFGAGCNQGAEPARGRYLCFLNSDALVEPGWLGPLVERLDADATVGAVVPALLNPDGTLQEAASVIDSVGFAHAVGTGDDPNRFEYRFRRDVDYGSAACLVTRRGEFLDVGGFDPVYSMYFEDVDLCFKLEERGLRTVYEPRARVVHVRFGSGNFEQARTMMERNRDIFYERWNERLARRPRLIEIPGSRRRMIAARDAEALDRILVIDDRVPHHDRGSGDPRMARLLAELAALWPSARITLAAAGENESATYAEPLLAQGIEVVCPPVDWQAWFEERVFHYSVVIVSRVQNVERFGGFLRWTQPQALRVFDSEALTFRRLELRAALAEGRDRERLSAEAARTRELELAAAREADAIFCVSPEERELVSAAAPGVPAFVLPGAVETAERPPGFESRRDLLFFGGFLAGADSPNQDALLHLVHEVLPLFWEREPDAVLHVVGADVTPAVSALQGPRVNIVGYVDDPREWLDRVRLHVNPMRFGAGVKQKLLDTMAAGVPFVTTPVGAEGLLLGELTPLLVADDPRALAELVHRLYTDPAAWKRVQRGLLDAARVRFGPEAFRRTLLEAMSQLGVAPEPGAFTGLAGALA